MLRQKQKRTKAVAGDELGHESLRAVQFLLEFAEPEVQDRGRRLEERRFCRAKPSIPVGAFKRVNPGEVAWPGWRGLAGCNRTLRGSVGRPLLSGSCCKPARKACVASWGPQTVPSRWKATAWARPSEAVPWRLAGSQGVALLC